MDTAVTQNSSLIVDGRPFLAIGGELHNSSSSDPAYLAAEWRRLAGVGINTVLVSVAWAEVERTEGDFDFRVVDELVRQARGAGLRLGVIWFGAFKNALSTYAPTWVRADTARFPRAVLQDEPLPTPFSYAGSMAKPALSVFSPELVAADARAFAAFVGHLTAIDDAGTVIMIQVENEIGLLGSARDHSAPALAAWNAAVPDVVVELARNDAGGAPRRGRGGGARGTRRGGVVAARRERRRHPGDVHGVGVRIVRRADRGSRALVHTHPVLRQRLARSAARSGQAGAVPERRADRADARTVAGGGAVARLAVARHLHRRLPTGARGVCAAREPALRPGVALLRR